MKTQSGNALFLILLAIFLLGGLTVLLSRTSGTTEETGSTEQLSLKASKMLQYAASIKTGVDMLRARGCSEEEISFETTDPDSEDYENTKSPTDGSCNLFSVNGAGMPFKALDMSLFSAPTIHEGRPIFFAGSPLKNAGTGAPDLMMYYNGLSKEFCMAINNQLGIAMAGNNVPSDATENLAGTIFKGVYPTVTTGDPIGDPASLTGKKSACYYQTTGSIYQFYYLLIAR